MLTQPSSTLSVMYICYHYESDKIVIEQKTHEITKVLAALLRNNYKKHGNKNMLTTAIAYTSAPQPFLTCDTLIKLAKFGDTPQQTTLVKTQIMQKTIGIYSRTSMRNLWLF